MKWHFSFLGLGLALLGGCSSSGPVDSSGSGGGGGAGGAAPGCKDPVAVPCSDQVILKMNLQTDITKGLIGNQADGAGFISTVDATAGGYGAPKPESYTCGRFTDQGLVKVEISDEQSLDSMDWDIAFRRFIVRINSGNSGPSCVAAGRLPDGTTYESVTSAPDELLFHTDDYFSKSCELVPDGSGLGSPATALSSYWGYGTCVAMKGYTYVVRLADGKQVKLTVTTYYLDPAVQEQCNTTDTLPAGDTGSANFHVRWAFLP